MDQTLNQLNDLDKFILARWAYSVGEPIISDAEYTQLLRAVTAEYPDSEYVNRSWSSDPCPTALLQRVGREDLIYKVILSDKTESIPSLNSEIEVRDTLGLINCNGTLSMKHDGWNIQANYFRGRILKVSTRGRSGDFVDVSKLAERLPQEIPVQTPCKVVMELTVSKENFKFCAQQFGNVSPRASVSTILAKPEYHYLLDMHAFDIHGVTLATKCKFEVLRDWGFNVPMYKEVVTYQDLLEALQWLSDQNEFYGSPTDGAVYDGELRRAIRLLAWEEPIYKSYVTGYLEQYGPNRISPSVYIYPILRKGSTQKQLSVTNWQRIIDYNLRPGAPIAFRIASDATADFDEESTRLLHKEYAERFEEYQELVKNNEEMVRCFHNLQVSGV